MDMQNNEKQYTSDEIINFFDEQMVIFRDWVRYATSDDAQELYLRYCDVTSYLKNKWLAKNNHFNNNGK